MQIDHQSKTQDGSPNVVHDGCPHVGTRWPPQDGLQGKAVRGDQASRGGKLGTNRLAGEQLDINQAGMGVVRG